MTNDAPAPFISEPADQIQVALRFAMTNGTAFQRLLATMLHNLREQRRGDERLIRDMRREIEELRTELSDKLTPDDIAKIKADEKSDDRRGK